MNLFKSLSKSIFLLCFFCAFLVFESCDVGLGESVDTIPPTISITYPPTSSVIRDAFVVSGTWVDDKGVSLVKVTVRNDETGATVASRFAGLGIGRWNTSFNVASKDESGKLIYPIPDGKYTISVTAMDLSGRISATSYRSIEIDNTAPVFVISKPGVLVDNNSSSALKASPFGSIFRIVGSIAEAHSVKSMEVKVFAKNGEGEPIASWKEEDINISGGTSVTFARFTNSKDKNDYLHKRYIDIYGDGTTGSKEFSCSVTLTDSAGVYQSDSYSDSNTLNYNGNKTSVVWLNDDINAGKDYDLLSKNANPQFEIGDLMKILNGTYNSSLTGKDSEAALNALKNTIKNTEEEKLAFSINKDANPTYSILGYGFDDTNYDEPNHFYKIISKAAQKGMLALRAQYGQDGTYFFPKELKVYVFGPYIPKEITDMEYNALPADERDKYLTRQKLAEIYDSVDNYYDTHKDNKDGECAWLIWDGSKEALDEGSTSNYSVSVQLPEDIKANNYYVIAVTGVDKDGLNFIPENSGFYGLIGASNGVPPVISLDSIEQGSYHKDISFLSKISGRIKSTETVIESVTYRVKILDILDKNRLVGVISGSALADDGKEFLNAQDINYYFGITEEQLKEKNVEISEGKMYAFEISVDGLDNTGGAASKTITAYLDTKKPEIKISSVSPIAKEKVVNEQTKQIINGIVKVIANVTEEYLENVKITVKDGNGKTYSPSVSSGSYIAFDFNTTEFKSDSQEDAITIEISAVDKAGNYNTLVDNSYVINQSSDTPLLETDTKEQSECNFDQIAVNNNLFGIKSNNKLTATITDDDGIGAITAVIYNKEDGTVKDNKQIFSPDGKKTYNLTLNLPKEEGKYVVSIEVKDIYYDKNEDGKVTTDAQKSLRSFKKYYNVAVDAGNPVFNITTVNNAMTAANTAKTVEGTASDFSGLKSLVRYAVNKNDDSAEKTAAETWWFADKNKNDGKENTITFKDSTFTDTISADGIGGTDGRRRYIATDIYGNESIIDFVYFVDNVAPVITEITNPAGGSAIYNGNNIFALKGKANDNKDLDTIRFCVLKNTDSEPETVASPIDAGKNIYKDASGWQPGTFATSKNGDGTTDFTCNIDLHDNDPGEYKVFIALFDKANNQSYVSSNSKILLTSDKNAPVTQTVAVSKPGYNLEDYTALSEIVISVKASDDVGLKSITVSKGGSELTKLNVNETEFDGTVTLPVSKEAGKETLVDGTNTFSVVSTDFAGNSSETKTFTITLDSTPPDVSISSVTPIAAEESNSNIINGVITIKGSVIESNLNSAYLEISNTSEPENKKVISLDTGKSIFTEMVDTTQFNDGGITIKLSATDVAGNNKELSETSYKVLQSTDSPSIETETKDSDSCALEDIAANNNLFGTKSNNKLTATITDDDGIAEVTAVIYKEDGTTVKDDTQTFNPEDKKTFNLTLTLPSEEAKYVVKINAKDIYYDSDADGTDTDDSKKNRRSFEKFYNVGVDAGDPVLSLKTANNAMIAGNKEKTVEGTASDSGGLISLVRYAIDSGDVTGVAEAWWYKDKNKNGGQENTITIEGSAFTDTISAAGIGDADGRRRYIATDIYGNTSTLDFSYLVDSLAPVIKVDPSVTFANGEWRASKTQKVQVLVTDTDEGGTKRSSGITNVKYVIDPESANEAAIKKGTDLAIGAFRDSNGTTSGKKVYNIYSTTFDFADDGTHSIYAGTWDSVGNYGQIASPITYKIDTTPPKTPELLGGTGEAKDSVAEPISMNANSHKAFNVYVTSDDKNGDSEDVSGIKKIIIRKGSTDVVKYELDSAAVAVDSRKITIPADKITEGTNTFTVYSVDAVGNESIASSPITINYDGTAPEVKFTSHKAEDSIYKTITLKGSVHEANGLSSEDAEKPVLQYKLHSASEWTNAVAVTNYASISVADGIWTVTDFDTTKLDNTETAKSYDLRLIFTDIYGNKNADAGITVSVDQNADRPVISLTTISEQNEVVSSRTIYGNVTDSDGTVKKLWVIEKSEFDSSASFVNGLPKEIDSEKTEEQNKNGWTAAKLNNSGSWSVNFNALADSDHSLYFCVQDAKNDIFYTTEINTTEAKLARPRIALSGVEISNAVDNNAPLSFSVDTVPPKITMYVSNEALAADAVDGNGNTLWAAAGLILGGTKNNLYIKLEVIENNIVRTGAGIAGNPYVYRLPSIEIAGKSISPVALRDSTSVTGAGTAESPFVFLLAPITLEKATYSSYEGSKSVMATLPDISGQEGQGGTNIILDYTAPTVQIISPTAQISDAVSAAVTVKGIVTDNYSAIERLEYVIPRKDDVYNTTSANWAQVYNSGASWEIEFSSGSVESTESLCYYGKNYANYTGASEVTSGLGVYKVPMWFRATDSVGNIGTITVLDPNDAEKAPELFVYVDPDGGKPKAWINAPEQGTVTSGTVTIYGGASDNVSVSRVCIQIDADNDGDFDEADFTKLKSDLSIPTPVSYNAPSFNTGDLVASSAQDENDWYIVAEGTNSWKYTYNSSLLTVRDSKQNLRVRVRAIDNDGQTRVYSEANDIRIDSTVPWFTNVRLCRYGSSFQGASDPDADTPVVAEREYVSGMYISDVGSGSNGIWYLVANVNSNTSISNVSSVSIPSTTSIVIDLAKDGTEKFVDGATLKHARKTSENEYTLTIPLDTTQSGVIQAEISAVNTVGNGSQQIKINIDSTPPALYNKNGSETYSAISEGAGDNKDLRVKSQYKTIGKNGTSSSAEYATIENSDGFFTFGDSVKESGSGLQYLAFYFKNTVSNTVYDPMNLKTGNVVVNSKTDGKLYINEDNLAAFYIENATRNAESTFEYSDLDERFVRKGGLVKIGGTYHLISEVNNATKTVSFAPGVSKAFKEVEIIYAQVVDHMLTESFEDEYDEDDNKTVVIMNDDGDGMCETINQIGSVYQWTASINSNNIPDGTTEICVAAIDNAGNISSGKVESMVANNRPRITKVFIGTDLNGNNSYDFDADEAPVVSTSKKLRTADGTSFGEFNYYGAYDTRSGFGRSTVTIASNKFKVTNGLCVIPEFTGGNGSLKYVLTEEMQSEPQTAPSPVAMTTRDSLNIKTVLGGIPMFGNTAIGENGNENPVAYGITDNSDPGNPVTYGDFGGIVIDDVTGTDGEVKTLSFTFWDETDGKQDACGSQWAILNVPVTIKSGDSVPPKPLIKPFHWLSATDNSIVIEEKIAKGHIELEDDLAGGKWSEIQYVFGDTEALKKPKVSGKIKLEGTVYDDVRLSSIKLAVFGGLGTVVSNYTNGAWVQVQPASLPTGVVSFEAEDLDMSQNGHTVKYTAVIDTEKTSVGINKTIVVNAVDWKNNTVTTSGSNQTKRSYALWSAKKSEANAMKTYFTDPACTVAVTAKTNDSDIVYKNEFTDCYIMDVVPYVTEIVTPLSPFYRQAPSVYARTALGSYPVKEGSSVEFRGFNLGTDAAKVTINGMTPNTSLSGGNKITIEGTSSGKTGATSGAVSVYVNDIPAINNLNNNDAQGNANKTLTSSNYEDYAYNRQPNGINNNVLTDDLELDVWQFKEAARAKNGSILQPHMKVGPEGQLGFSYANATLYFNMPGEASNGTEYGQTPFGRNFGGFTQNAFTYDSSGTAYGVALCPDTSGQAGMSANLQFFSGKSGLYNGEGGGDLNNNYYNQDYARRIENTSLKLDGSSITQNINRIQSPSMTTYTDGSNKYVYVAYYDELSRQVRFRVGSIGSSRNVIGMGLVDLAGATGRVSGKDDEPKLNRNTTRDSISGYRTETISVSSVTNDVYVRVASTYGYNHIHAWDGYSTGVLYPGVEMPLVNGYYIYKMPDTSSTKLILNNGGEGDSNKAGGGNLQISSSGVYSWNGSKLEKLTSGTISYSTMPTYEGYQYCHVVAASGVSNGTAEYNSATSKKAGQYVSVGALSDGTAVMAWYDSGAGRLAFSYNSEPLTAKTTLQAGTGTWQNNSYYVSDSSIRAGTHVSMAVDASDGIHLAYYSASGGDLYYSYIENPKAQREPTKTVMVDSYGSVGTYTMIDVARDSETSQFIPYISFRCESNADTTASVKIAYPVKWSEGNVLSGVDEYDRYTGNWEVSVIPTDNTPLTDYTNIGLNKNWSTGVRSAFSIGSDVSKSWSATFAVGDSTTVYGNGTNNPILSYAVSENGVLEMAQKK